MARIRINARSCTKEKPYSINSYILQIAKEKSQKADLNTCLRSWYVLKDFYVFSLVTRRPEISPFLNLFSKNENNYNFQKKIIKVHKKDTKT